MKRAPRKPIQLQSLLCCRVCLMNNCKLYNIHEYKLNEAFLCITGTSVSQDRLPPFLCAYCFMMLLKCSSFRDMSLRSQELLSGLLKERMDTYCIHRNQIPQRLINLTQTEVEIVEVTPSEKQLKYDYDDEMVVETLDDDLEIESDEIDRDDSIQELIVFKNGVISKKNIEQREDIVIVDEDEDEVEIDEKTNDKSEQKLLQDANVNENSETPEEMIEYLDDNYLEVLVDDDEAGTNDDNCKQSTVLQDAETQEDIIEYIDDNSVIEAEMRTDHDYEQSFIKSDKIKIKSDKIIKKASTTKKALKIGDVCNKKAYKEVEIRKDNKEKLKMMTIEVKNNKIQFRVTKNPDDELVYYEEVMIDNKSVRAPGRVYEFDEEAFEKKYNVKIITLNKEDQLEEIALRKKSRNYLESPYRCDECGRGFGIEQAYNNHRFKHNPSNGPHICEICGFRFQKRSRYMTHRNIHRYKFCCNSCDFVSRMRHQARIHFAMHEGKTYECPYCAKVFAKRSTYFSHVRLVHPALNVVCEECGETFVSDYGLKMHKNMAHSLKSKHFECNVCSVKFSSAEALKTHTDTAGEHVDLRPCEQCGQNCASEEALQEHVQETHPPQRCELCDKTFVNEAAFVTHEERVHAGRRPPPPPRRPRRPRPRPARPDVACVCDQCGATLRNSSFLVYHMREHNGVKPFACPHCPKRFVLKHRLNYHMRMHTGEKPFQCPKCPLAFSAKGNFKRHFQTVHLGIRGHYPCPVCGRPSTTKGSMQVHLRAVHGDAGWPKRDRSKRKAKTQDV